jgi:hypothetical protein
MKITYNLNAKSIIVNELSSYVILSVSNFIEVDLFGFNKFVFEKECLFFKGGGGIVNHGGRYFLIEMDKVPDVFDGVLEPFKISSDTYLFLEILEKDLLFYINAEESLIALVLSMIESDYLKSYSR